MEICKMSIKAPVSMCIITKDDSLIKDCVLSIKDYVEEIVIVDTGSTPENQLIAKGLADIFEVYTACNNLETGKIENFSKARQRSFDLATKPWISWMDSDDIIEGGENLIRIIQAFDAAKPDFDALAVLLPYEYAYDTDGRCTLKHYRERLISNKKHFRWLNPVHEVLVNNDGAKIQFMTDESIVYKHRRQFSTKPADPQRNLRILKKYVEGEGAEGAGDARQLYYLGLEYANNGFIDEAIGCLTKHIDTSGWDDERVMACLKLVDIYTMMGNHQEGLKWAFKAVGINEHWGEGYFALGKMFYWLANNGEVTSNQFRNWQRCVNFIKQGLALSPTKTLLFINPLEREHDIHKYLNMALNKIGDVRGALESVNIALQKQADVGLSLNKKLYEEHLSRCQIIEESNKLKTIGTIDQSAVETIVALIHNQKIIISESIPAIIKTTVKEITPFIIKDNKLDIVFALGDGVEIWNPDTVKQSGIGGSETMAMELAKRLAALGNRVRVYNSCGQSGSYDDVEYYPTPMYQDLNCDVLIVSRNAEMLDDRYNIRTKLTLLWVHDVFAINAKNHLLLKADKILALSEWHKQNLINMHHIHPDHVLVTRNGLDLNRFNKKINRNKYRAVNSSSPDRSWPILLECWPEIKSKVPKAELHLYYGFKNWEYSAKYYPGQSELIVSLKEKIKLLGPQGVVYHDRVSQEQLAEEFLQSGVWAHSTWFSETSCISAMEAHAAGLRMVTSSIAALNETIASRGVLIDGDWTTPEYKKKFVDSVVDAMNKNDGSDRVSLQKYAKDNFGLDGLAQDWDNMFHSLMEELKQNPLIPYQPTKTYRRE